MPANSNNSTKNRTKSEILRYLFKGVLLAAVLWFFFSLAGRVLRPIAIAQIAEMMNTKAINAKSVDFNFNGAVRIQNLVIRPEQEERYDDAILRARAVYVRFGIVSLLLLHPKVNSISLTDFVLNAQCDLDSGLWNIAAFKLNVPKGGSGKIPVVRLKNGKLRYSKVAKGQIKVITEIPIEARLKPARKIPGGYSFEIITARSDAFHKSALTGYWKPGEIKIMGGISSADIPAFERAWSIDNLTAELAYDRDNNYSLKLQIKDLSGVHRAAKDSPETDRPILLEKFGPFVTLQEFFSRYRPAGRIEIDLGALGNLNRFNESTLQGKIYCKDVSICSGDFPYLIEHIAGDVDFTEKSVRLNNLCGDHNDVRLSFDGWFKDLVTDWQYQIRIRSDNMALDNDLYDALSAKQKEFWSVFSPKGTAAIEYHFSRSSPKDKKRTLTAELRNAEAMCRYFPYPLKNLTGKLSYDSDYITISEVTSDVNERKIILNGKVTDCGTNQPIYDISINASNVPLDSTLSSSLPERYKHFYNQFRVEGLVDADIKVSTFKGDLGPAKFTANVFIKKASLKANDFPFIISDTSAAATIRRDFIHIKDFNGRYGGGLVSLSGQIWPGEEKEQYRYNLSLDAKGVEINNELIGMLPEQMGKIVCGLEPKGKINISADFDRTGAENRFDYRIIIGCLDNSVDLKQIGCHLKDITGNLEVTRNNIKLENICAKAGDDVRVTQMPAIKINGQIAMADDTEAREKRIDFGGEIKFEDCDFSRNITGLNGCLQLRGLYERGKGLCNGQAKFTADKVRIKGKCLTALKTDISYDSVLQIWQSKNLTADCHNGRLAGKFELKQTAGEGLEYLLQAGFENIDLKQFLMDHKDAEELSGRMHIRLSGETERENYTSGKMDGSLNVAGQIGDDYPGIGRGRLVITDMQVGKMSPLAKVLAVLKLTEPRDFAFDQMLVDSYIEGNKLFLEKLDLSGESVAFNGSGWMDLRSQNVDLTLTARGRRLATAEPGILQSLTDALGCAVVRMKVTGNFYDPMVTTTTLPVFRDSLEILGTKPGSGKNQ